MNTFVTLQQSFKDAPVVKVTGSKGFSTLDIETWYEANWFFLSMHQPHGAKKLLWYWSQPRKAAEQNYEIMHSECQAVAWPTFLTKPIQKGQKLEICKENNDLIWIQNLSKSTGQLARWRLHQYQFEFDLGHRAGIKIPSLPIFGTWNWENRQDSGWKLYLRECGIVSSAYQPSYQWSGRKFVERYCVFEICDVTVENPLNALPEVASIGRERDTHIATDRLRLERTLKE